MMDLKINKNWVLLKNIIFFNKYIKFGKYGKNAKFKRFENYKKISPIENYKFFVITHKYGKQSKLKG